MGEDVVNHPSHYTRYEGMEVIDLTEQMTFNLGNAVKYIARAGFKNPGTEIEDLRKAIFYIKREMGRVTTEKADYTNYGEIVEVLCSQLTHFRAQAVLFISRQSNKYLDAAVAQLEEEIKLLQLPPEKRMQREDLFDAKIHARNHMVFQYVGRALRVANEPHYDFELVAKNTAHDIIQLFY